MTATDTETATAEAKPLTDEEWAALFAAIRSYVPVAAMTSDAALKVAKFDAEQAARVEKYRREHAARAEEYDRNEALRRREWDVPSAQLLYGLTPLPKRDPGASLPVAVRVPPDALANFTPMPGSEKAVENAIARHEALAAAPVAEVSPAPAEDPDAAAQERADESLAAWTGAHKTLADEKADEAVEAFTAIHDTDPAGTAVLDLDAEDNR